jgi:putative copper resistance protein D
MLAALAICRMLHYSAAMVVFGASVYVWSGSPARVATALNPLTWRLVYSATAILGISTPIWLALEAGSMGEGWSDVINFDTIKAVFLDTGFGTAWQAHSVLVASVVIAVIVQSRRLIVLVSAITLASLGLIGHAAAMQVGVITWLHRANLALHLLSAGFWLGSLIPVLATLAILRQYSNGDAIVALQRFSGWGHCAVATAFGTGLINTVLTVGTTAAGASAYVRLLAIKIVLVSVMIGLAIVNGYSLLPQLRDQPRAVDALIRNTTTELVLATFVVGLVSLFGLLEP